MKYDTMDKFWFICNAISIVVYYIIIIYTYDKEKESKKNSSDIIGDYVGKPFILAFFGFLPVTVVLIYVIWVLIVGTLNIIRQRKFFDDIQTFGLIDNDKD